MSTEIVERAVMDGITADLKAAGYEVIAQPRAPILPSFLAAYKPDLIALREDGNLVIEVKSGTERQSGSAAKMEELLRQHAGWSYKLYWIPRSAGAEPLRAQSIADIERELSQIETLVLQGHRSAGFLLAWAVFEALGRKLLVRQFVRPQTPGRLIEVLAGEGFLTPDEASRLRPLANAHNRLVHGELDRDIDADQAQDFLRTLRALLDMAREPA
jgi:hypothetical protein